MPSVSNTTPASKSAFRNNAGLMEGPVDVARKALCNHICDVPEIPTDTFLASVMPPAPVDVTLLVTKLSEKSRVRVQGRPFTLKPPLSLKKNFECWEAYRTEPIHRALPGRAPIAQNEKTIYSDLENIAAQIVKCCKEIDNALKQTNVLKGNGTKGLPGHIYTSAEPDGVRVLVRHKPSWDSAAVTEEYKLRTADATDNHQKVIWNMFQTLRSDARRRFVFGVTFENTTVRLWHMNREVTMVSEPFDMNANYRILADAYARFAFASVSQLGYDHTVRKRHDLKDGTPSYRLEVGDAAYITTGIFANHAAQDGLGRCTRVFQAYKEGDPSRKAIYAVKDNWMEEGRALEVSTYNDILAAIKQHDWTQYRAPPKSLVELDGDEWERVTTPIDPRKGESGIDRTKFFIPILAGVLVKTEDGRIDNTKTVMAGGHSIPLNSPALRVVTDKSDVTEDRKGRTATRFYSSSQQLGTVGNKKERASAQARKGCFERKIGARVHHRSVMLCGTPLDQIKSASTAFKTLSDASYGLFILHQLGYCHRDASPYNVLDYDGGGVLADFDYTRNKKTNHKGHTLRTGTANFMAVEVMQGAYLKQKTAGKNRITDLLQSAYVFDSPTSVPWNFRDVHDLESIWWIVLWLLFRHTAPQELCPPEYDVDVHKSLYPILFPGTIDASERDKYLRDDNRLKSAIKCLPPQWRDTMTFGLNLVRLDLQTFYSREDANQRLTPSLWYCIDRVMCAAGASLVGELIAFTFEGRTLLLEDEPEEQEEAAPMTGDLDMDHEVSTEVADDGGSSENEHHGELDGAASGPLTNKRARDDGESECGADITPGSDSDEEPAAKKPKHSD
ncbi:hypothetical protein HDZ31DRAFT_43457 [Schizophyllum fasciatum]